MHSLLHLIAFGIGAVVGQTQSCVVGGATGYDGGGIAIVTNTVECFNESSHKWISRANVPTASYGCRGINLGPLACVLGGDPTTTIVNCLDYNGSSWVAYKPATAGHDAGTIIYGPGWLGAVSGYNAQQWEYTYIVGGKFVAWTTHGATLSHDVQLGVSIALNGTPCVVGGMSGSPELSTSTCLLGVAAVIGSTSTMSWVPGPNLNALRAAPHYITYRNMECIVGGASDTDLLRTVDCINSSSTINNGVFTLMPELAYPIPIGWGSNASIYGMQCIVGGVYDGNMNPTSAVWCLNDSGYIHNTPPHWIPLPNLTQPKSQFATILYSGYTPPPTLSPTTSPTTRSPSKSPTHTPTTLTPSHSPTISPTTTSPTTMPTSSPTTSPTLSPTTSPTLAPTQLRGSVVVVGIILEFPPLISPTNQSTANANHLASYYLTQILAQLNITSTTTGQAGVTVGSAYFDPSGNLNVQLVVDTGLQTHVETIDGSTVSGVTIRVKWPSLIGFVQSIPLWAVLLLALLLLGLIIGILWLSHRLNPDSSSVLLFGFLSHFFNIFLQAWAAYTLYYLKQQRTSLAVYFFAYIGFLCIPVLPNSVAVAVMVRVLRKASETRHWLWRHGPIFWFLASFSAISNTRILGIMYSGAFGRPALTAPVKPVFRRLVQASGIVGLIVGDLPRSTIQIIILYVANDTDVSTAVALPLLLSLLLLLFTALQTCYFLAYAEKDIIQLTKHTIVSSNSQQS